MSTLDEVSASITALCDGITALKAALADKTATTVHGEATHAGEELLPAMAAVRLASDELKGLVADDVWPLAT